MLREKESEETKAHKKKLSTVALAYLLLNYLTVVAYFFKSWENYSGIRTDKIWNSEYKIQMT
jgi:hypothetical protein